MGLFGTLFGILCNEGKKFALSSSQIQKNLHNNCIYFIKQNTLANCEGN